MVTNELRPTITVLVEMLLSKETSAMSQNCSRTALSLIWVCVYKNVGRILLEWYEKHGNVWPPTVTREIIELDVEVRRSGDDGQGLFISLWCQVSSLGLCLCVLRSQMNQGWFKPDTPGQVLIQSLETVQSSSLIASDCLYALPIRIWDYRLKCKFVSMFMCWTIIVLKDSIMIHSLCSQTVATRFSLWMFWYYKEVRMYKYLFFILFEFLALM